MKNARIVSITNIGKESKLENKMQNHCDRNKAKIQLRKNEKYRKRRYTVGY